MQRRECIQRLNMSVLLIFQDHKIISNNLSYSDSSNIRIQTAHSYCWKLRINKHPLHLEVFMLLLPFLS